MLRDFISILVHKDSTIYFIVSFLSACAQFIVRTALYVTDDNGVRQSSAVVQQLNSTVTQAVYYLTTSGALEVCTHLPDRCITYSLADVQSRNGSAEMCAMIAEYPATHFRENSIEDLMFVVIHAVLVFVTIYAIARESIPHVITIFVIRFLNLAWSTGRIVYTKFINTALFKIIDAGGCQPDFFFLHSFFSQRLLFETALVITSTLSVVGEAYIAYRLVRVYSCRPWRVVEVPSETRKMFRQLLGFSVTLQLAAVFVPITNAMWAYLLLSTWFRHTVGDHWFIYGAVFIVIAVAFPIWMGTGWYALRKEKRKLTAAFLFSGGLLFGLCIAGLASASFLWSLTTWWCFGTLYVISLISFATTLVLAVVCRRNFGNNLDHYLVVKSRLSAMGFTHGEFEKDDKLDNVQTLSYLSEGSDDPGASWLSNWKRVSLSD